MAGTTFQLLSKPPTKGDEREMYRWQYRIVELLNEHLDDELIHLSPEELASLAGLDGTGPYLPSAGGAVGNGTDQSFFEPDGTLRFEGDAVVYDDVYPSAVSVGTSGANVPSFTAYSGNMKAYEFLGAALTKEMWAEYQIYHSYEEGTDCVPHLHLYIPDNATGGIIRFGCEYHWDNVGDTGAVATTTVYGTITRAANAGVSKNHILSFGSVAGLGKSISSILSTRVFRDPTDAGDTFAASVWLRSADVHIIKDTVGSRQELVK